MKTIGILGGVTWESTQEYYQVINHEIKNRSGGYHSGKIIINSLDFNDVKEAEFAGDWDTVAKLMVDGCLKLQTAGADMVLLGANTLHKVAPQVEEALDIPLVHIGEATGKEIQKFGLKRVGLLGTKFTMEEDFYKDKLKNDFGLEVYVPDENGIEQMQRIIFEELCHCIVNGDSKEITADLMIEMVGRGAQGIILGCTELPMLIWPGDIEVPLFDTTELHALYAVEKALAE